MKVTSFVALTALAACGGPNSGAEIPRKMRDWWVQCHGADPRGTDKGPSVLSPIYRPDHHSDA